jgi:hypothetical protein
MAEDAVANSTDVSLGFSAASGFASSDLTSPVSAAQAGALIDVGLDSEPVTELRIHGVSGSSAPTMLEHPHALQVAGDELTGFYRRWAPDGRGAPSVPWKLEAYACSGLTVTPLSSASWLLLVQFMMYNVAYFMLPPAVRTDGSSAAAEPAARLPRDRGRLAAGVMLRLLALAATIQFVAAAASALASTVAWQAAGRPGMLPSWMGWYEVYAAGWRVALALAAAAAVVGALYSLSVITAGRYEKRTTSRPPVNAAWPLTQPGFWKGRTLVRRQRALHAAAGFASVALIGALAVGHTSGAGRVMVALDAVVLAAAVVPVTFPLADRHLVTMAHGGTPAGAGADWLCRGVLAAAVGALAATALVTGWAYQQHGWMAGALPGLTGFLAVLLAVQVFLLIMLAGTVAVLARRARAAHGEDDVPPYLGGNLASLVAVMGFWLGWLLAAVVNLGLARLLGTPVPSGFRYAILPTNELEVPWPIYAFGAAPVGLLCGATVAAVVLLLRYRRGRREFAERAGGDPSPVAAAYADATAGPAGSSGDDAAYARNRGAIASAWSAGRIADGADVAAALAVGASLLAVEATGPVLAVSAGPPGHPTLLPGIDRSLATFLGLVVAGWLLAQLRRAYSDPSRRRTIGVLWDVGTFWPRAVHPLAPPCYAERTVPEIVDRIRLLTGHLTNQAGDDLYTLAGQQNLNRIPDVTGPTVPAGPVLLTGYSQGSIIALAAVAQLTGEVMPQVGLLTLACPARLYGRAFPAYFGRRQLAELARMLDAAPDEPCAPGQPAGRWKNLRRKSDPIGSPAFAEPRLRLSDADLHSIDQPCWDPVILVPDQDLSRPPIHGHSQWWPDQRVKQIEAYLVHLLTSSSLSGPGRVP